MNSPSSKYKCALWLRLAAVAPFFLANAGKEICI